jgi:hypothetical protein
MMEIINEDFFRGFVFLLYQMADFFLGDIFRVLYFYCHFHLNLGTYFDCNLGAHQFGQLRSCCQSAVKRPGNILKLHENTSFSSIILANW